MLQTKINAKVKEVSTLKAQAEMRFAHAATLPALLKACEDLEAIDNQLKTLTFLAFK